MKDLKEYIDGKVVDGYVSLEDCLSALEQAYNDGLKDNKKDADEIKRPLWKDDYEAYLSIVKDSRESLLFDDRHKALFLKYNPRCDYKLTIEKTIEMFWGTEDGWNYCAVLRGIKHSLLYEQVKTVCRIAYYGLAKSFVS